MSVRSMCAKTSGDTPRRDAKSALPPDWKSGLQRHEVRLDTGLEIRRYNGTKSAFADCADAVVQAP